MQTTTLYLTRHGQTQWNLEGRTQGQLDSPLTELGVRQATWLRDALHDVEFTGICTSSSPRAIRTAEILRAQRLCEVMCYDDLREISMGTWEGKLGREIQLYDTTAYDTFWHTPHLYSPENGGESFYDLQKRVVPFIDMLVSKHGGETILIVSHGITVKTIMSYFEGRALADLWRPPIIHSTALSKVVIDDQHPRIMLYADTSHYQV